MGMPWMGFNRADRALSYSPSPLSGETLNLHPSTSLHSDDDIKQALEAISTLSFSFDSLTSSFSASPLMEQGTGGEDTIEIDPVTSLNQNIYIKCK